MAKIKDRNIKYRKLKLAGWPGRVGKRGVERDGMEGIEGRKRKRYLVTCHYNYFAMRRSLAIVSH